MDEDQIKQESFGSFKKEVRSRLVDKLFDNLQSIKMKHSKVSEICYNKFNIQEYMTTHKLNNHEISLLFSLCTRTLSEIKGNFPSQHKNNECPLCCHIEDTQEHCLSCDKLNSNKNLMEVYSDI